jgi:hypothetical protein
MNPNEGSSMRLLKYVMVPLSLSYFLTSCGGDDDTATSGTGGTGGSAAGSGGSAGTLAGAAGHAEPGGGGEGGSVPFDGSCATLPGKIVYIESGDTQENLLKNLGRHLRDTANITLVFNLTGSCTLTNDIYTNAKVVPNGTLKYIPSSAEDPEWSSEMAEPTCTTPVDGVPVDLAISALFVESCGLGGPPDGSGLGLIQGPIQAYTFVVPTASDQTAIWAEEAYYAFGFGDDNPLAPGSNPWNDEAFMFIRPPTKSTLVATAKNIDVPPNKWKGVPEAASGDVATAVSTSTEPEATIGILGAEVYDGDRDAGIQTLAFQAFGQSAAYYPDSTSESFDKQNVRDGHYTLWSPTVYITEVDDAGVPVDPAIAYITDLVVGNTPVLPDGAIPFDALADVINVGLIPDCAMQVTRSEDGGDLSPFAPAEACTCYYLSQVPDASGTPDGCTSCTSSAECDGGSCNHGFCEPNAISTAGPEDPSCFSGTPTNNAELIDACTTAQSIEKDVALPSGELEPLP